jgi:hypothetical protein
MRWYAQIQEEYWGTSYKQLVEVNGEKILHRAVRLLKENGVDDIWITSHNPVHEVDGTKRYEPPHNEYEIDKFYSPVHLWNKKGGYTLFVYGDVFFTEEAMKRIVATDTKDFLFFGRFHWSHFTGHGGEIFAIKVKDHSFFQECCLWIRNNYIATKGHVRCGAWELYRCMNGIVDERISYHSPYSHFVGIDDFTDDFDTPGHFENWLSLYEKSKE